MTNFSDVDADRKLQWWSNPFRRESHSMITDLSPEYCQHLLRQHLHVSTFTVGKLPEIIGHLQDDLGFSIRHGVPLPHGNRPLVQGRYHRGGKRTEIKLIVWVGWRDAISIVLGFAALMFLGGMLVVRIWEWANSGDRLAVGFAMIVAALLLPAVAVWWFTYRRRGFWDEADDLVEWLAELLQACVIS